MDGGRRKCLKFFLYISFKNINLFATIFYFCSNKDLDELKIFNDEKDFVFFPIRISFLLLCAKKEIR